MHLQQHPPHSPLCQHAAPLTPCPLLFWLPCHWLPAAPSPLPEIAGRRFVSKQSMCARQSHWVRLTMLGRFDRLWCCWMQCAVLTWAGEGAACAASSPPSLSSSRAATTRLPRARPAVERTRRMIPCDAVLHRTPDCRWVKSAIAAQRGSPGTGPCLVGRLQCPRRCCCCRRHRPATERTVVSSAVAHCEVQCTHVQIRLLASVTMMQPCLSGGEHRSTDWHAARSYQQ